jgi:hypothetical protein
MQTSTQAILQQLSQVDRESINNFLNEVLQSVKDVSKPKPKPLPRIRRHMPIADPYEIERDIDNQQVIYAKYYDDSRAYLVPIPIVDPETAEVIPPRVTKQSIRDLFTRGMPNYRNHLFITIVNRLPYVKDNAVQIKAFTPKNIVSQYWKMVNSYHNPIPEFYVFPRDEVYDNRNYYLKDAVDGNCVLNILQSVVSTCKNLTNQRTMQNKLNVLKELIKDGPFEQQHMQYVQKMGIPMTIYHNAGKWDETPPITKVITRKVEIFAHDGHATEHIPLGKITSVNYLDRNGWNGSNDWFITNNDLPHQQTKIYGSSVSVTTDNPLNKCECDWMAGDYICDHKKDHPPVLTSNLQISAYQTGSTLNKTYRPPSPDDQHKDYYYCTNELSYEYKKFIKTNRLRPLQGIYYDLIKSADHHFTNQQFVEIDPAQQYHSADINKAYRSFQHNPYYEHYKLPTGNVNLIKFEKKSINEICMLGGWSCVSNIKYNDPLIEKTKPIQNNAIYTHLRLRFILDNNLATFDIDYTITAKMEHLEFPFKTGTTLDEKKFNNQFIGKFIQKSSNRQIFTAKDRSELGAIIASAKANPDYNGHISYTNNIVEVDFKGTQQQGLYHIHSYIIDYAIITLLHAMIKTKLENIVCYNTDGFYSTIKPPIEFDANKLHGFKYALCKIRGSFKQEHDQHTPIVTPVHLPTGSDLFTNSITNGPAGCGKSRQVFTNTYHSSIMLFPTHTLRADGELKAATAKLPLPTMTVQKYYYDNPNVQRKIYENVYIDEVTMISREFFRKIMQHAFTHRYNVHFIGDIDEHGLHQLPPVSNKDFIASPLKWVDFNGFYKQTIITADRRQSNDDCVILDSLRNFHYKTQLKILKQHLQCVSQEQAVQLFDNTSIALVGTNLKAAELNTLIYNKQLDQIRVRTTKKYNLNKTDNTQLVKGQMTFTDHINYVCHDLEPTIDGSKQAIYLRKESNVKAPFPLEMMYAGTTDALQGCTHDGKIFIDVKTMDRENILYTAVTRCKKLSDVYLIV